jgi:hypothetical protein
LISTKASGKAPTGSGRSISSPFRTKCLISIPEEFIDKSIEIESSTFIIKLLEAKDYITTGELYKWTKEPNTLFSNINIIIKSY